MKNQNLKTDVYEELRSRIINFKLLPGVRVSDKEIATELGISRTPVREALIRLAGEGLIQAIPNRGFRVKMFTLKEIEDLYTLRESLEVLAIGLATPKMDENRIREMRSLMQAYPALIEAGDLAGFNAVDETFHDNIAMFSENTLLETTLKNLHGQIRIVRRYDHLRAESFRETYEEHTQILEHMIRGEITDAQHAISRHIAESMKTIMAIVRGSIH